MQERENGIPPTFCNFFSSTCRRCDAERSICVCRFAFYPHHIYFPLHCCENVTAMPSRYSTILKKTAENKKNSNRMKKKRSKKKVHTRPWPCFFLYVFIFVCVYVFVCVRVCILLCCRASIQTLLYFSIHSKHFAPLKSISGGNSNNKALEFFLFFSSPHSGIRFVRSV